MRRGRLNEVGERHLRFISFFLITGLSACLFTATGLNAQSWMPQVTGTAELLNDVWFTDNQNGWAVGENGTILHTSNGGAAWSSQASGTANHLNSIYFIDDQHGWASGATGTILTTVDGGDNWTAVVSGTVNALECVFFINATTGWASGAVGAMLYTTDGGANWSAQVSGTTKALYDVHFADANIGWAVGASGTILTTANGGANWTEQTSGTTKHLISCNFSDNTTGWAVGNNGTIVATTDGGVNWTVQTSGTGDHLQSVFFLTGTEGWAAGAAGTIQHTTDGGANWSSQASGTAAVTYGLHFEASDLGWASLSNGLILRFGVNDPPVLGAIGPQSANEGTLLTFSVTAADPNGNPLTYSAEDLPAGASLSGATFTWTPGFTQAGAYPVRFIVSDGAAADSELVTITVANVNCPPTLAAVGPQTINEEALLSITLTAADADGGALSYSAENLPAGAAFTDSTFAWTPGFAQAGVYSVRFIVSDGAIADSELVTITVANVNQFPVLAAVGPQNVTEGSQLTVTLTATDADGGALTYSTENLPAGAAFTDSTLTWTPGFTQAGAYSVRFIASDGVAADSELVTITVTNVNQLPVIAAVGPQSINEGDLLTISLVATDADGGTLSYSAENLPAGAAFSDSTLTWTPGFSQAGAYSVRFIVSDGAAADSELVTITVANANQPLVLAAIGPQSVNEGTLLTVTLAAADADGDALTYSAENLPAGAAFSDSTLTWTPGFSQAGAYSVRFIVSDGAIADSQLVTITVTNVNQSPVLAAIGPQTITEGKLLSVTLTATDADGGALTYSAENLPAGAAFTDSTFAWTPGFAQAGIYTVLCLVTDGIASDSVFMSITVSDSALNTGFIPLAAQQVYEGQLLAFSLTVSQMDEDALIYTADGLPDGAMLTGAQFQWSPSYVQSGIHTVLFMVEDGVHADSQLISIKVLDYNPPPVFDVLDDRTVYHGETVTLLLSAVDPNADVLQYSAVTLPSGAALQGHLFTWRTTDSQAGIHTLQFAVTDGSGADTVSVRITVTDVTVPVVFEELEDVTVDEGDTIIVPLSGTHANGENLRYTARNLPVGARLVNDSLIWIPGYEQAGRYRIVVTASDGLVNVDQTLYIELVQCNAPPELNVASTWQIDEGQAFERTFHGRDIDGDPLEYFAFALPTGATFTGQTLQWTPAFHQSGHYLFTILVSDGLLMDSLDCTITVREINDPPSITAPDTVRCRLLEQVRIPIIITNPDGDNVVFESSALPLGASMQQFTLIWTPQPGQDGFYTVTLSAKDLYVRVEKSLCIIVSSDIAIPSPEDERPVNRPPVLSAPEIMSFDAEKKVTVAVMAEDPDGDSVLVRAQGLPEGAVFTERTFAWTPANAQAGEHMVTFTATDGDTLVTHIMRITVNPVHQLPSLDLEDRYTIQEEEHLSLQLPRYYGDGQVLTYQFDGLPEGASLIDSVLEWTPTIQQDGSYTITVTVSNGVQELFRQFIIEVLNSNQPPVLTTDTLWCVVDEQQALSMTLTAEDGDSDSLSYTATNLPAGAILTGAMLRWTPDNDQAGEYYSLVTVSDGALADTGHLVIQVRNVNRPPTLASDTLLCSVNENQELSIHLIAADQDGDSLQCTMVGLPSGATSAGTTLQWTPDYNQAGDYHVLATVSDGALADTGHLLIQVRNVNRPPVIHSTPATLAYEDSVYAYAVLAEDPDGEELTYKLLTAPGGMVIDPHTGVISWEPPQTDAVNIMLAVTDSCDADTQSFRVTVQSHPGRWVWPGDANCDGRVDSSDARAILVYWGTTVSPRSLTDIQWLPQETANSWVQREALHADADGNGIINEGDVLPVGFNWGKTRSGFISAKPAQTLAPEQVSELYPVAPLQVEPGREFSVYVQIGSLAKPLVDIYGVSFCLEWSTNAQHLRMVGDPVYGDFLGRDPLFVQKQDPDSGFAGIAISRKSPDDASGGIGIVARFTMVLTQPTEFPIRVSIRRAWAIDSAGRSITLESGACEFITAKTPTGMTRETMLIADIQEHTLEFSDGTTLHYSISGAGNEQSVIGGRLSFNSRNRETLTADYPDNNLAETNDILAYYRVVTDVPAFNAALTLDYGDSLLQALGIAETGLTLGYYCEISGTWKLVETVVDPAAGTVQAVIPKTAALALLHRRASISPQQDPAPPVTGLEQNYPNPFNTATAIRFSIATGGHTILQIFDIAGRKIRTLVNGPLEAGAHQIHWDGCNESGYLAASGIYIYRLITTDRVFAKQLLLIK